MVRDIRYLNLTKLLGGESLITRTTLTRNSLSYNLPTLLDSRANSYYFIDSSFLKSLSFFFKLIIQRLLIIVPIKGFNGALNTPISHYARLNLIIEGRL